MVNSEMSAIDAPISTINRLRGTLIGVVLFGVAIRLWNQFDESRLWLDELFSVAVAESPPLDVILTTLRFDTHPPLYYLQLHIWSLFNQSDFWYILNSTLWSIASILVMYRTVGAIYGQRVGLWAAAFFAILPLELFFAENVRMYAFVAVAQILLWGVLEAQLKSKWRDRRSYVAAAVLAVVITLSHGLGFLVVFFSFLQAGVRELLARRPERLLPMAVSVVPAIICSSWPLVIGSFRRTEGVPGFDIYSIGVHLTLTILGMEFPAPVIAGFIVFSVIALLCLWSPPSRTQITWMVLIPFTVLLLLSVSIKPVFIYRTMGLFLPYLAIAMALSAAHLFSRSRLVPRFAMGGVLVIMMASGVNGAIHSQKAGYRAVVDEWEHVAAEDALIITDTPVDFWALQRYLAEGMRFSALDVQPPVRDGMQELKHRLDGTPFEQVGFFGRENFRAINGRTLTFLPTPDMLNSDVAWVMNATDSCHKLVGLAPSGMHFEAAERLGEPPHTITACRLAPTSSSLPN